MGREVTPKDELLSWLTDFDSREVFAAHAPGRPPLSRRLVSALLGLGGGSVTTLTLVLAALTRPLDEEGGWPSGSADSPNTGPVTPTPSVTLTAEPPSLIPDTCAELFSEGMSTTLAAAGLRLDTQWQGTREPGSADTQLQRMLAEDTELGCYWVDVRDPERAGLLTIIAELDDDEVSAVAEILISLSFTELREHGGVRYVAQHPEGAGRPAGESHFLRDGLWFATRWYGHGPYGYTADMVEQVFR